MGHCRSVVVAIALFACAAQAPAAQGATLYDTARTGGIGVLGPNGAPTALAEGTRIDGPFAAPLGDAIAWVEEKPAQFPEILVRTASTTRRITVPASRVTMEHPWSPDGTFLLVRADRTDAGTSQILIVRPETGATPQPIAPATDSATWSPDGRYIALKGPQLRVWDTQTANFVDVGSIAGGGEPRWSPDSDRLLVEVSGQSTTRVVGVNPPGNRDVGAPGLATGSASWSADGTKIAFNVPGFSAGTTRVDVENADGTGDHQVIAGKLLIGDLGEAWSPTGSRLLVFDATSLGPTLVDENGANVLALPSDLQNLQWSPSGGRLVGLAVSQHPYAIRIVDSSSGAILATASAPGWLSFSDLAWQTSSNAVLARIGTTTNGAVISLSATGSLTVLSPGLDVSSVAWNIARTMGLAADPADRAVFIHADGSAPQPVVFTGGADRPVRNGSASWRAGALGVTFAERSATTSRLLNVGAYSAVPGADAKRISSVEPRSWPATSLGISPDDRRVIYVRAGDPPRLGRPDERGVYLVNRATGATSRVLPPSSASDEAWAESARFRAEWSPDATQVRVSHTSPGVAGWIISAEGTVSRTFGHTSNEVSWSPDGTHQVLVLPRASDTTTEVRLVSGAGVTLSSAVHSGAVASLGWSPSGGLYAYILTIPGGGSELRVIDAARGVENVAARQQSGWTPLTTPTRSGPWSRDGARILVGSPPTTVPALGGTPVTIPRPGETPIAEAAWAGNAVVYWLARGAMDSPFESLRAADGDGTNHRVLSPAKFLSADVSPDGAFVAVHTLAGLEVRDLAGRLISGSLSGQKCGWSPDGALLAAFGGVLRQGPWALTLTWTLTPIAGGLECRSWSPRGDQMLTAEGPILSFHDIAGFAVQVGDGRLVDTWGPDAPVGIAPPSITPADGGFATLAVDPGLFGNAFTRRDYQWFRCTPAGDGCSPIPGAISARYTPAVAQAGSRFRVREVAGNALGTASLDSAATELPFPALPARKCGSGLVPRGVTLTGTVRADRLVGTRFADRLCGFEGRDVLFGLVGNDALVGGRGNDLLVGGRGNDQLLDGSGDDLLLGGAGHDRLVAGRGRDRLVGGAGRDSFDAGPDNDRVNSRDGIRETVRCGPGKDRVLADRSDRLFGCESAQVPRRGQRLSGGVTRRR